MAPPDPQSPEQSLTITSSSPAQTVRIGAALGMALEGGCVVCLTGPLGAGKTMLVKGIARGMGLRDENAVTSPTFVLIQRYDGRLPLWHVDAYRLGGADELWALGIEELYRGDGVVVVEWAEKVRDALPDDLLWVEIQPTGPTQRQIKLVTSGPRSAQILRRLRLQEVDEPAGRD